MKYYFISFDISNDKLRKYFNKLLKKIGVKNIQYSVFLGKINSEKIEFIKEKSKLLDKNDKLCILEIRKDMIHKIKFYDNYQDLAYILNKKSGKLF